LFSLLIAKCSLPVLLVTAHLQAGQKREDKSAKTKVLKDTCAQAKSAKRQLHASTHTAYFLT